MKRPNSRGWAVALVVLVAAGGGLLRQWRETLLLRLELDCARMATGELARLRSENERWREKQIPLAQLETLRADHAALPRLRAELEALQKPAGGKP